MTSYKNRWQSQVDTYVSIEVNHFKSVLKLLTIQWTELFWHGCGPHVALCTAEMIQTVSRISPDSPCRWAPRAA